MGLQITLTDEDATRYLKWAANIRQPKQETEELPATGTTGRSRSRATVTATTTDLGTRREQLKDIRKWAAKHGFKIAAKGRIPQPVMEAYEMAHGR
ncbi:DNA bridging protein [Streptomyces phage BillNye]|uniref:DNA bridging protein n=2 Tax=Wilnyevirus billnye TaxID=2560486 RepID=A0A2L1IVR6_9CAUD|nr:nucloid associated Lsr2-like [Streptomyces phage BillNye]AVD99290.1 DNA bridging protein [Streptomyces phage BillNye]QBZ72373.1 Lsr2-like DNA bridging protein [Streptomyces phage Circinus]